VESLNAIAEQYDMPIIISTHPRTQKRLDELDIKLNDQIRTLKPLGFNDYIKLQKSAKAVLSDSGTISEETSILGLKSLNIREAHERPEAMEEATVMMVGLEKIRILQGLNILDQNITVNKKVRDYDIDNVSDKVLKLILSYT